MESPPRILLVAPYPVLPTWSGGKIRIVELARRLARSGFEVCVLAPYKPGQRRHHGAGDGFALRQVAYPFVLPLLLTDRPFPYGYLVSFHPGYAAGLRRFLDSFDAYQLEHPFFGDLIEHLPRDRPIVYDAHNVEYDYVRSECDRDAVSTFVGDRIRLLESDLARRASRVLVCSKPELERFVDLYDIRADKLRVLPNGVRRIVQPRSTNEAPPLGERLPELAGFKRCAIFTGSNVAHNRQAARFIIERIAPRLASEWAFVIHGTVCGALRDGRPTNVFLDPAYDGLARYAWPDVVGLNPVTQGGGTSLKLTLYLAHGMPVVSTEFGVRGYDDLRPYVTVAPVDGLADALASAPALDPAVTGLLESYLWENVAADLAEIYRELLEPATLATRS